jgi:uncharacterized Zn finger protein
MGLVTGAKHEKMCPICGSDNIMRETEDDGSGATVKTRVTAYPLFKCRECGSYHRSGHAVRKTELR